MAKIAKATAGQHQFGGFSPFGNVSVLHFSYTTNSKGAVIGADHKEPVKEDDVVQMGTLPAGFTLTSLVNGDALSFEYVNGETSTEVPEGLVSTLLLKVLPYEAFVTVKATAGISTATEFKAAVLGELKGPK